MAYNAKTNWQNNEIVEASDMNRIEQGISDVDTELGNIQTEVTTHKAETAQNHVHGLSPERVRAIYVSTNDPDDAIGEDGDIWIKYEE